MSVSSLQACETRLGDIDFYTFWFKIDLAGGVTMAGSVTIDPIV